MQQRRKKGSPTELQTSKSRYLMPHFHTEYKTSTKTENFLLKQHDITIFIKWVAENEERLSQRF